MTDAMPQPDDQPTERDDASTSEQPRNGASADAGSGTDATTTKGQIFDALRAVVDPELGINIVDLGLVYDVEIDEEQVTVTYTLTTMGCPVGPLIEQQMQQILTQMPGISIVESRMTFNPPWSPEKMSEEARLAMGMF